MRPMLATRGTHVPPGDAWTHEVKWDGVRALTDVSRGSAAGTLRMTSRNENVITVAWPELSTSPLGDRDLLVDGEIIALNERGLPDFRTLQERMHARNARTVARLAETVPAIYMVFDLLRLDGRDLTAEPLEKRRELLAGLEIDGSWQVPASYDDGAMLFDATLEQGLEGIVSKRRTSRYTFGERTPHWLKFAHRHRLSYVVGGWRPQEGTTDRLAALLVGEPTPEGLLYRGRVGSGIGPKQSRALTDLVADLGRADSPFADEVPRVDAAGTRWLEPVLVVDIDTHGRGYSRLRQPSYQGVRADLTPEDL
ncbi:MULTISPECIES: ATP-dependent DNA ligase [unclassified Nocardioides]|uniref:ATP-dependent DNA ligase n=1 Tax=unclassified Nocardioides TaxID=2615069 RepID=UPI0009F0F3A5|nr:MULTISPECIES: DNA ligase [unclassified Nocardioides]GAW50174.1 ATP dependent DNA ligase [Nocardioides sp. PD653-B2]GAW54860.1 ATP dependent DNA ligase [Nocardioides sp. PD653]